MKDCQDQADLWACLYGTVLIMFIVHEDLDEKWAAPWLGVLNCVKEEVSRAHSHSFLSTLHCECDEFRLLLVWLPSSASWNREL